MRGPGRALAVAIAAFALLVGGAAPGAAAPDFGAANVVPYDSPKPAPAFTLPDLAGKPWSLAQARGKVVMLFFWATW
jgi:cytochrome oxidase Cu insertion factor (SCO1/SenC/PrrC family)